MPLDLNAQKAVQALLTAAKDCSKGLDWEDLHTELFKLANGRPLILNETKKVTPGQRLAGVAYTANGRPRVRPSENLAIVLLEYWEAKSAKWREDRELAEHLTPGNTAVESLAFLKEPPRAAQDNHSDTGPSPDDEHVSGEPKWSDNKRSRPHSFISALGIDTDLSDKVIQKYSGNYLHFALDEEQNVVVARSRLSKQRGSDYAPIYRSWRQVPGGVRRSLGAYFCSDENLYIIASPRSSVDLRMSLFNIIFDDEQVLLRGVTLSVAEGAILTSRCMLAKESVFAHDVRQTLCAGPQTEQYLKAAPHDEKQRPSFKILAECARFLFGEEKPTKDIVFAVPRLI
ncbi:hypothetical protein [Bradyrhizobium sp. BWC-3-1]|uniref:hypothetical protein n=1 Tax=Bradyrhizobium sp. BWC-3-1 TaxID=3080012 RepID=UPI00293EE326|nr:hypothetical protein [Bradyrhizobium sp. BWC-3-1]WOH57777.1 hypothetical protein RX329_37495 [Bradyrhizobium sp. BWC-3-1]